MADTPRTLAALQALLATNAVGDISGQDIRDFLVSVFPQIAVGDLPGIDVAGIIGRLPATTDGFVLTLDATQPFGFKWAAAVTPHNILSLTHSDSVGAVAPVTGALLLAIANKWDTSKQTTHELAYTPGAFFLQNNGSAIWTVVSYGAAPSPIIRLFASLGTMPSGGDITNAISLGKLQFGGARAGFKLGAYIDALSAEDWSATLKTGAFMRFYTTAIGATTQTLALTIGSDQVLTLVALPIWPAQTANKIWAGPASGGAAAPTMRALVAADIPIAQTYSVVQFTNVPDAAVDAVVVASANGQGAYFHSGPTGFTATKLYVDARTAPGASGLPCTWAYGDTDDLDTVASWTTIATYTLSSEKSNATTSMTNAVVPAGRLVRTVWGTIVGSPANASSVLEGKRQLSA